MAKITLTGMQLYMEHIGDDLFADFKLPEGIDKETVVSNIMWHGGEFEVCYSEPFFIKRAIKIWANKWYDTFERWIRAWKIEYEPLENYDRTEQWVDMHTGSSTGNTTNKTDGTTSGETNGTTSNESEFSEHSSEDVEGTDTVNKSAFNESAFQPYEQTHHESGTNGSRNGDSSGSGTDKTTLSGSTNQNGTINTTSSDQSQAGHEGRMHGNIGVTTSQQMLQAELDVSRFNIVDEITRLFLMEFIIPIYD